MWAETGIALLGQSQATLNECVVRGRGSLGGLLVLSSLFSEETWAGLSHLIRFLGKTKATKLLLCQDVGLQAQTALVLT